MIEKYKVIPVNYGNVHFFTLGKIAWRNTFKDASYPIDSSGWFEAAEILVSKYTKILPNKIISLRQIHGNDIFQIKKDSILDLQETGLGKEYQLTPENLLSKQGDGLLTFEANTALVIRTADCVPVFCYSKTQPMVSILHAGWRGVVGGITEKLLHWLVENGFKEETLHINFGASIYKNNYPIQSNVADYFSAMPSDVISVNPAGGYFLGSKEAILFNLNKTFTKLNINPESSDVFSSDKYYSHRSKDLGRNFNVIFWES